MLSGISRDGSITKAKQTSKSEDRYAFKCEWPGFSQGDRRPCERPASYVVESGRAYCDVHIDRVFACRDFGIKLAQSKRPPADSAVHVRAYRAYRERNRKLARARAMEPDPRNLVQ